MSEAGKGGRPPSDDIRVPEMQLRRADAADMRFKPSRGIVVRIILQCEPPNDVVFVNMCIFSLGKSVVQQDDRAEGEKNVQTDEHDLTEDRLVHLDRQRS